MVLIKNFTILKKKKILNSFNIIIRTLVDAHERWVEWHGERLAVREKFKCAGFVCGYPFGPIEAKGWEEWYLKEFKLRCPKGTIRKFWYLYFWESIDLVTQIENFELIKSYVDASIYYKDRPGYYPDVSEQFMCDAHDLHEELVVTYISDNYTQQWGIAFLPWIISWLIFDFVLENLWSPIIMFVDVYLILYYLLSFDIVKQDILDTVKTINKTNYLKMRKKFIVHLLTTRYFFRLFKINFKHGCKFWGRVLLMIVTDLTYLFSRILRFSVKLIWRILWTVYSKFFGDIYKLIKYIIKKILTIFKK